VTSRALATLLFRRSPGFGFDDLSDEGLARVRTQYERQLADGHADAKQLHRWLRKLAAEQTRRAALRAFWWAADDGHANAFDYSRAVLDGESARPDYWLALLLDYRAWRNQDATALDWDAVVA